MPTARVIKAVDVLEDGCLSLATRFPRPAPDQFGLDGFEERFDGGIVVTVAFAAQRRLQAMFARDLPVVMRTVLRAASARGRRGPAAVIAGRWPFSMPGSPDRVSCGWLAAQPITRRECRSRSEAMSATGPRTMVERQMQPALAAPEGSGVARPCRCAVFRFWLSRSAVKSRSKPGSARY